MAGMNVNTRDASELHLVPRRDVGAKYFPAMRLATTSTLTEPWTLSRPGFSRSLQPAWYSLTPSETVLSYRTGSAYRAELDPLFTAETYGDFRRAVINEGVQKSEYDNGHPFVARSVFLQPPEMFTFSEGGRSTTFSPVPGETAPAGIPTVGKVSQWQDTLVPSTSRGDLDAWGTDAINRVVPTKPQMSVTTFLGELVKDGFPSLVGLAMGKTKSHNHDEDYRSYIAAQKNRAYVEKKRKYSEALAGEHLNFQFAVKPLVADLKSFYKTVKDFNSILNQYNRDSGRLVRRQRYEERPVEYRRDTKPKGLAVAHALGNDANYLPASLRSIASIDYELTKYQSYSFSGGFMYYVPSDPGVMNNLLRIESDLTKLFGAPLSPEVLWNLAPWSWLSDWLANVGTVLGNYQALQTDDLAIKYAYVTRRTVHDLRITTNVEFGDIFKPTIKKFGAISQFAETIRQPATPFGFGLSSESFSPRQWSILAALGFTLGPEAFKKSS